MYNVPSVLFLLLKCMKSRYVFFQTSLQSDWDAALGGLPGLGVQPQSE